MDYMRRCVIASKVCTPSTAGTELLYSQSEDFQVYGIEVVIQTAGAQATHKIDLRLDDDTVLASVTTGTSAAATVLRASVAEGSVDVDVSANSLKLTSVTNDATAEYLVSVIGTTPVLA